MMTPHHTPGEQLKGLLGLISIWTLKIMDTLPVIQQGLQVLASVAAIVASIIYARYYFLKTRKEKGE
jgi:hypothetical protein